MKNMSRQMAKALSVENDLGQLPVTHQQTIPEYFLDLMGHMNVSWYTHLFSSATINSFHLVGMDERYFRENHSGSFALESHIHYLAEVLVGKQVSIRTRLIDASDKLFHFMHFMINDDDRVLAATGEFLSAHIDMRNRRVAPFSPSLREAIQKLCSEHAQLSWDPPVCGIIKP